MTGNRFDGDDYVHERDSARLTGRLLRIWEVIKDGNEYQLGELSRLTGDPEASVSAQLRNLRKARFGGHDIRKRHISNGLYAYWLHIEPSC